MRWRCMVYASPGSVFHEFDQSRTSPDEHPVIIGLTEIHLPKASGIGRFLEKVVGQVRQWTTLPFLQSDMCEERITFGLVDQIA